MDDGFVPRDFTDADGNALDAGYYNGTLGTTGVALKFPPGSSNAIVTSDGAFRVGVRSTATLETSDNAHYGALMGVQAYTIKRSLANPGGDTYLHILPIATAKVAVLFV